MKQWETKNKKQNQEDTAGVDSPASSGNDKDHRQGGEMKDGKEVSTDILHVKEDTCPDCGSELDTGYECKGCGKDWLYVIEADKKRRKAPCSSASAGSATLPAVEGRIINCSLNMFKQRAKLFIAEEQLKLNPDNGLIEMLCDAIRLAREQEDHAKDHMENLKEKLKS